MLFRSGVIVTFVGFILLIILTFGDLGELFTEEYWRNVGGNITSIGALTIGLMFVQISIRQGVSEQALSNGLNTENTKNKYVEHKDIIKRCRPNHIYLPYFLGIRNERETIRRRKEFLVDNRFLSEEALFASGIARNVNKRAIVNVVFILLSKVIVALFAFLSTIYDWIFPLWIAVLSDVGVSVVAIFNSLSILNLYPREKKEKKNGNKKRNQVL